MGAGKGEFFVDRCIGLGGFFRGGILTDCAECCEKVKHCQKKPSAFALFMSLFTFKVNIIACPIVKKTKKKINEFKKKNSQEGPAATPAPPGYVKTN